MRKYLSSFGRELVAKLHHGFRLHLVFVAELVGRHLESCSFVQRAIWVLYTHLLTQMLLRTMRMQERERGKKQHTKWNRGYLVALEDQTEARPDIKHGEERAKRALGVACHGGG